jgi:hypothetical protein
MRTENLTYLSVVIRRAKPQLHWGDAWVNHPARHKDPPNHRRKPL